MKYKLENGREVEVKKLTVKAVLASQKAEDEAEQGIIIAEHCTDLSRAEIEDMTMEDFMNIMEIIQAEKSTPKKKAK